LESKVTDGKNLNSANSWTGNVRISRHRPLKRQHTTRQASETATDQKYRKSLLRKLLKILNLNYYDFR
jgi:hypothetical protein